MQRAYAECAEGYSFKIDPCPPDDPQRKGIVESGVKYLKGNSLLLRTFRDLADLNAQARTWVIEEAGVRCHGTTRRAPLALFALEAPLLQALPNQAPVEHGEFDRRGRAVVPSRAVVRWHERGHVAGQEELTRAGAGQQLGHQARV